MRVLITVIIVAFQNVRDEKQASPAKFPSRPIFPQVSKERPASSRREYRQAARCVAAVVRMAQLAAIMSEKMPKRTQLSRKKGWRMPPNTVSVARPSKWGNPYRVEKYGRERAIQKYREWLTGRDPSELRGKNLAVIAVSIKRVTLTCC